jgi:hypothetical protein
VNVAVLLTGLKRLRGRNIIMSSSAQRISVDSMESTLFSSLSTSHSPSRNNDHAFPRHDTSRRPSSSGTQRSRTSTIGSVSSIGGALDILTSGWSESVRESGQNGGA